MKNYKRLLSLVLLLAMILSLGCSAFAEDLETAAEGEGYGSTWDDWDDAPAEEPAVEEPVAEEPVVEEPVEEEPVVEEPVVEEPVVEEPVEEPVVEEPVEDAYPANDFFYVGGSGLRVTVEAPEGAFPADAVMTVTELKPADVQAIVNASGVKGDVFAAADITFSNAEGELQPEQPVTVRITAPTKGGVIDPRVVHIDDYQNVEEMEQLPGSDGAYGSKVDTSVADDCTLYFEAYSFSTYAIIGTAVIDEPEGTLTFKADGYSVKVSFTAAAEIPVGTELTVYEITKDSDEYAGLLEDVDETLNAELDPVDFESDVVFKMANMMRPTYQVDDARMLEITLVYEGREIEPAEPVTVEIIFDEALSADKDSDAKVVHFADAGTEVIDDVLAVTDANGDVTGMVYEQSSFSTTAAVISRSLGNTAGPNLIFFPQTSGVTLYIRYGDYDGDHVNEFQIKDNYNDLWPGDPGYGKIGNTTYFSDGVFDSNTTMMEIIEAFNSFVFYHTSAHVYTSYYDVCCSGITFIMDATYQVDATTQANTAAHLVAQAGSGTPQSWFIYTGQTAFTPNGINYHDWDHDGDRWSIGTGTSCEFWRSIPGKTICIQRGAGADGNGFSDPIVRVVGNTMKNFCVFEGVYFDNCSANSDVVVSDGRTDPASASTVPNIAPVCIECDGTSMGLLMMFNGAHITDSTSYPVNPDTGKPDRVGTGVRIVNNGSLEMFRYGNTAVSGLVDSYIENMAVAVEQYNGKTRLKTSIDPFSDTVHNNEIGVALSYEQSIGKWYGNISALHIPVWLRHVADWKSGDIILTSGLQIIRPATASYVVSTDKDIFFFENASGIQTMMGLEYYLGPGNGVYVGHGDLNDTYGVIRFINGTVLNTRTGLWYATLYNAVNSPSNTYIQPVTGDVPIPASFLDSGDTLVFYGDTREDKTVTIPANMTLDIRSSFLNEHTNDSRSGNNCTAVFANGTNLVIPASSTVTFGGNKTSDPNVSGGVITGTPSTLTISGSGTSQNLITNNGTLWLSENAVIANAADYGVYQNGTFHLNGGTFDSNTTADVFLCSNGTATNNIDDTLPGTVTNHVITVDVCPAAAVNVDIGPNQSSTNLYVSRNVAVSGAYTLQQDLTQNIDDLQLFPITQTNQTAVTARHLTYDFTAVDDTQNKPVLELKGLGYFFVYHSSNCLVEKIFMDDQRIDANGKFDLTNLVRSGHLYGGYFSDYGGKSSNFDPETLVATGTSATDNGNSYDGSSLTVLPSTSKRYWVKDSAAKVLRGGSPTYTGLAGTAVEPKSGDVYFLKEVPDVYLKNKVFFIYDTADSNNIKELFFITAIDDALYADVGFSVSVVSPSTTGKPGAKFCTRFTFQPAGGGTTQAIYANSAYYTGVTRGYLGVYRDVAVGSAQQLVPIQANVQFSVTPFWETLDGVEVLKNTQTQGYKFDGGISSNNLTRLP